MEKNQTQSNIGEIIYSKEDEIKEYRANIADAMANGDLREALNTAFDIIQFGNDEYWDKRISNVYCY